MGGPPDLAAGTGGGMPGSGEFPGADAAGVPGGVMPGGMPGSGGIPGMPGGMPGGAELPAAGGGGMPGIDGGPSASEKRPSPKPQPTTSPSPKSKPSSSPSGSGPEEMAKEAAEALRLAIQALKGIRELFGNMPKIDIVTDGQTAIAGARAYGGDPTAVPKVAAGAKDFADRQNNDDSKADQGAGMSGPSLTR